jgi:hypothetical protein
MSYHSVIYYVKILFIYYGYLPTMMDAVLAPVSDVGQAMMSQN